MHYLFDEKIINSTLNCLCIRAVINSQINIMNATECPIKKKIMISLCDKTTLSTK